MQALSQIGGYLSIFGVFTVVLRIIHRYLFRKKLKSYIDKELEQEEADKGQKLIENHFSYETFTQMYLELSHLKSKVEVLENRQFVSGGPIELGNLKINNSTMLDRSFANTSYV